MNFEKRKIRKSENQKISTAGTVGSYVLLCDDLKVVVNAKLDLSPVVNGYASFWIVSFDVWLCLTVLMSCKNR